jgi:hypothetical protein
MAYSEIDIGAGATNRGGSADADGRTRIGLDNPANATGVLTSFEVLLTSSDNLTVGTFTVTAGQPSKYTSRDSEYYTNVASGSKQVLTGGNCDAQTNDYLGIYLATGNISYSASGCAGSYYYGGNAFGVGEKTYTSTAGQAHSVYATGLTVPDAPTSVAATDNLSDRLTVTWTAGVGETDGHRVYRDGSDISGVVTHGTATYNDTTAVVGTTYTYTVKAINAAGLSTASSSDTGIKAIIPFNIFNFISPILAQ